MTVFAVMTAGLFPIIHIGRPWKFFWLIPYPNWRLIWPNFKCPLVWDVFAISTYLTVSSTFLYVGLIPDIAVLRDRETNPIAQADPGGPVVRLAEHASREWRHFARMYLFLAAFCTPLVLSVHSVVSFDFAMALTPGWHATIFPPYFVAGAIFSGIGMVFTIIIPIRKCFSLEHYVTLNHLDAAAKLCLFTSIVVGCAYLIEFWVAWYSRQHVRAGVLLEPRVRPVVVGRVDHADAATWSSRCRSSRRSCGGTRPGCSSSASSSTSACGSSGS